MLRKLIKKIIKEEFSKFEQQIIENKLIKQFNEGLIKSYPLLQSVSSITKFLNERTNLNFEIYPNHDVNVFDLVIHNGLTNSNLKEVLPFINTFGYFPSSYYIERNKMTPIFDKYSFTNLSNILNDVNNNYKSITLRFEAKYDNDVTKVLPRYIYHISDLKNKGKILKLGLLPKNNVKATHPERIYFLKNLNNSETLVKQFNLDKYIIFKIDRNKLDKSIKFYNDPNFIDNQGVYTYSNIKPEVIQIFKTL